MPSSRSGIDSYADGLRGILTAITNAMSAPDADMRTLLTMQMGVLGAIKAGPAGAGAGAQPGGSPQGGQPPGMSSPGAPAMAGAGQTNPMQTTPTPPRGMAPNSLTGMGAMQQNPDELRRMLQSQVGA